MKIENIHKDGSLTVTRTEKKYEKKSDKQKENIQKTDKHKLTLVTPSLLGVKRFADVWEKGK